MTLLCTKIETFRNAYEKIDMKNKALDRRFSTAPMMERSKNTELSNSYKPSCALRVRLQGCNDYVSPLGTDKHAEFETIITGPVDKCVPWSSAVQTRAKNG